LLINAYPVAVLNALIALVNVFYLLRMLRAREYFQLLPLKPDSVYLPYFLNFYREDIARVMGVAPRDRDAGAPRAPGTLDAHYAPQTAMTLMSAVSLSEEFGNMVAAFGWDLDEMEWLTLNAMKSAFIPFDARLRIINGLVKPGYARLRAETAAVEVGGT